MVTSLAIKDQNKLNTDYDEIDGVTKTKGSNRPYSDKSNVLDQKINRLDFDNTASNKNFRHNFSKEYQDYEDILGNEATKEITNATQKLTAAFPNSEIPLQNEDLLSQKAAEIEGAIRKADTTALNINPTGLGARTSRTKRNRGKQ